MVLIIVRYLMKRLLILYVIYLSIYMFIPSIYLCSYYLSMCKNENVCICHSVLVHPSIHLPMYVPIHPSIHSSIYLFIHQSIHLSIYSSIHLSIHSLIHPSFHPSIHLSIHPFIQGYSTNAGSKDTQLSGGQKQKLP